MTNCIRYHKPFQNVQQSHKSLMNVHYKDLQQSPSITLSIDQKSKVELNFTFANLANLRVSLHFFYYSQILFNIKFSLVHDQYFFLIQKQLTTITLILDFAPLFSILILFFLISLVFYKSPSFPFFFFQLEICHSKLSKFSKSNIHLNNSNYELLKSSIHNYDRLLIRVNY